MARSQHFWQISNKVHDLEKIIVDSISMGSLNSSARKHLYDSLVDLRSYVDQYVEVAENKLNISFEESRVNLPEKVLKAWVSSLKNIGGPADAFARRN